MKITWKELVPAMKGEQRQLASGTLLLTIDGHVVVVGEVSWSAQNWKNGEWTVSEHGCGCCAGSVTVTHYSDDLVSVIEEAARVGAVEDLGDGT